MENDKQNEKGRNKKNYKGRNNKMLSVKELIRGNVDNINKKMSPVEEALKRFRDKNGYDFLEMINDEKIRKKHLFRQLQKKDYNDNEFFELFQDKQGE